MPTPTIIENPQSKIENPPTHSFTLLLGHPNTGKSTRALQFAAAASNGTLPISPALPFDPDALLPDSLLNFLPPPLAKATPATVLLMNPTNHPDLPALFRALRPNPARLKNASIYSLIPARRRCTFDSPDHPITPLHSLIHHHPEIRVLIIDNLYTLVGRHSATLIPALLELARRYRLAILATDTPRSHPLPYHHLATIVHYLPSRKRATAPPHTAPAGPRGFAPADRDLAIEILQTHLAAGPQPATALLQDASSSFGLSRRTLFRAKQSLNIHAFRTNNQWLWQLPKTR